MELSVEPESLEPTTLQIALSVQPEISLIKEGKPGTKNVLANEGQELVIFVGAPGSGKSSIWGNYFKDYTRVNNDNLKTPAKCMQVCLEALAKG